MTKLGFCFRRTKSIERCCPQIEPLCQWEHVSEELKVLKAFVSKTITLFSKTSFQKN